MSNSEIINPEYNPGAEMVAPVYNGEIWSKIDLMKYIQDAINLKSQIDGLIEICGERLERINFLKNQMTRKTLTFPILEKPRGLAALSSYKKRQYQEWLSNESKREEEKKCFDKKEDERIQKLNTEMTALQALIEYDGVQANLVLDEYKDHMLRNIIPPAYRDDAILRIFFSYLVNSRAHNLTDAINLYHQEKHWQNLEEIAEQQRKDIKEAQRRQESLLREQIAMQEEYLQQQQEQLHELQRTADAARSAAQWSEFWSMSEYFAVKEYINR